MASAPRRSTGTMPGERIVGVGGTEADQRALEVLLRGADLPVARFLTVEEALSAIASDEVDLLLLDLMLASNEVFALLRAAVPPGAGGNRTPVIVTAPPSAKERVQACLQRGAEDYLTTPFDPQMPLLVTRRVELCLRRRRLREFTSRLQMGARGPNDTQVLRLYTDSASRFVPREFLQHLHRDTLADVKLGDHVQRDMTVFFSDIRDFTTLSEQLTPQQNFDFLNSYLKQVTPIIRGRHGFIDKYIGDGIMALFPEPGEALAAAVDLGRQVVRYNQGRHAAGYTPIRIGIGIHRGDLILGTIGEEERMQTTVIADAVNVASRIEGLTKTFGVSLLVSGTVIAGLEPQHGFRLRHLGAVKTKGQTRSVAIYECYDNDPPEAIAQKEKTAEIFAQGISEFRKGMFLTAGRIFARLAEMDKTDIVAAYYRDRCTLSAVRERGPGIWDGAEKIELK
ncbi:MAG: adenylate/guanylate cyclase domain-containing protein [Vulcanimicrobiaceae bacterium]